MWSFGFAATLMRGWLLSFSGFEFFAPDLVTLMTAYLYAAHGWTAACVFALFQGTFIDVFSGGMNGLFAFLQMSAFGAVWASSRFFDIQSRNGQAVIVFIATMAKTVLFVLMVAVVSRDLVFPHSLFWRSISLVAATALCAPFVFFLLESFRSIVFEHKKQGSTGQL